MAKILVGKVEIENCAMALFEAEKPPGKVWAASFDERAPGMQPSPQEVLSEEEREEYRERCRAKLNSGR